jgi:hypothetical protein
MRLHVVPLPNLATRWFWLYDPPPTPGGPGRRVELGVKAWRWCIVLSWR